MKVSADLNETGGDDVDAFLEDDMTANSALKNRKSGNRKSTAYQSYRDSSNFAAQNKFGESRRLAEDGEDVNAVASIKMRQSAKIEKLGTFAAAASIFKAFVGLGVLFLPYQFWDTGTIAMPTIMIGSLMLTLYCTTLLIECADEVGNSFSEIAEAAYGPGMRKLTQVLIICSQFSFCTNYVYFIASQVGSIFNCAKKGGEEYDDLWPEGTNCAEYMNVYDNVKLWAIFPAALFCIFTPLVFIRDMEKLAWSHLLGNILILLVIASVVVYSGIEIADTGTVYKMPFITSHAAKAIPLSAFAFEGVAVVMPLREIVEDQENFMRLTIMVVSGVCLMYILYAEFAIMAYGD